MHNVLKIMHIRIVYSLLLFDERVLGEIRGLKQTLKRNNLFFG